MGMLILIIANQYRILGVDKWFVSVMMVFAVSIIFLSATVGRKLDDMKEEKDKLDREVEEIMKKREF